MARSRGGGITLKNGSGPLFQQSLFLQQRSLVFKSLPVLCRKVMQCSTFIQGRYPVKLIDERREREIHYFLFKT